MSEVNKLNLCIASKLKTNANLYSDQTVRNEQFLFNQNEEDEKLLPSKDPVTQQDFPHYLDPNETVTQQDFPHYLDPNETVTQQDFPHYLDPNNNKYKT